MNIINYDNISSAIEWSTTRSKGPGGQHVNKTNSAVILKLDLDLIQTHEKNIDLIYKNLEHRIIQNHFISVRCETERDQKSNKDTAIKLILKLLNNALYVAPKRYKTKPSRSSVEKRLSSKTKKSNIKKLRSHKIEY